MGYWGTLVPFLGHASFWPIWFNVRFTVRKAVSWSCFLHVHHKSSWFIWVRRSVTPNLDDLGWSWMILDGWMMSNVKYSLSIWKPSIWVVVIPWEALTFETDVMGPVTVTSSDPTTMDTAYGMLQDGVSGKAMRLCHAMPQLEPSNALKKINADEKQEHRWT